MKLQSILIVDDSPYMLHQLSAYFEEEFDNPQIFRAENGKEALEVYTKSPAQLITMDLSMPHMDGMEAIAKIMAINPKATIIVISAVKNKDQINLAMRLGAKFYFEKPLRLQDPTFVKNMTKEIQDTLKESGIS